MRQIQRTIISQRKAKTAEAVANRGVDADAPRGETKTRKKKTENVEVHKIREKCNEPYNT